MLYKARENVRKAVETRNPVERQTWLGESLRCVARSSYGRYHVEGRAGCS